MRTGVTLAAADGSRNKDGGKPGTRDFQAHWWVLPLILFVAVLVRLWRLGSLPPALFRDEAEKALNAWFILNHGVDETGRPWPVFIEVFGVITSAIYQYATIPFLTLGGLNEWTARLPAAVVGITTVLFTWLLCRRVWGWQVAAWAAGLLAVSPWHVPLSRWAQQGIFLPLLFVAAAWGMSIFLKGHITYSELQIEKRGGRKTALALNSACGYGSAGLLFAAACVAVAMYAYDPARLFAPLLGLVALVIWGRTWLSRWQSVCLALFVFFLFASPVLWLLATHGDAAQARFRHLSVFQPGVSVGVGLFSLLRNYVSHFSPSFLLLHGDAELRHSGGVGMLNIAEFVFAVVGAILTFRRKCRWCIFIVLWVVLAPVAASLTRVGVPHALRSQMALPAWQILAALGIMGVTTRLHEGRQKRFQQVPALFVLLGSFPFFFTYFGDYSSRSATNWQYGVKESLMYLNQPVTRKSEVFFQNVTGAEYLVPFYIKMDRPAYVKMLRGVGRYHFLPFYFPDPPPPLNLEVPAAWITPFGTTWQVSQVPIPIMAPGSEQMLPVMLIYLNQHLLNQIKVKGHCDGEWED